MLATPGTSPEKTDTQQPEAPRKAAGVGLLALSKDLAELHGAPMAVQLPPVKQSPEVGTDTGVGGDAGVEACSVAAVERHLVP